MSKRERAADLRTRFVEIALAWQDRFGVAPAVTSALSELGSDMSARSIVIRAVKG
jgi:hypothetical protein